MNRAKIAIGVLALGAVGAGCNSSSSNSPPDAGAGSPLDWALIDAGSYDGPFPDDVQVQAPPPEAGAACTAAGDNCQSPGECCSGLCSAPDPYGSASDYCGGQCDAGSGCLSGCCAPEIHQGIAICAPPGYCPNTCVPIGTGPCTSYADCCGANGQAGCFFPSSLEGICANICTVGAQCRSGCCMTPPGWSVSICSPSRYCQ